MGPQTNFVGLSHSNVPLGQVETSMTEMNIVNIITLHIVLIYISYHSNIKMKALLHQGCINKVFWNKY